MLRKLAVALIGFVAVAAVLSVLSHFRVAASEAEKEARLSAALARSEFTPAELREDIATLRTWLDHVHPDSIPSFPLAEYDDPLESISASIDQPLSHLDFFRRIAPVFNRLNDEHTMVYAPDWDIAGGSRKDQSQFDVAIVDGRLFVHSATHGKAKAGDEIVYINWMQSATVIDRLATYYSGTATRQRQAYLEDDFGTALRFLPGMEPPWLLIVRDPMTGAESTSLFDCVCRAETPDPAFEFAIIEPGALLFSYHSFEDEENRFDAFLEELFSTAQEQGIETLIIDLRRNRGGASAFGDQILDHLTDQPFRQLKRVDVTVSELVKQEFIGYVPGFLRWLPIEYLHPFLKPLWTNEIGDVASIDFDPVAPSDNASRFDGDVYVLIGPRTMSSASLFAAAIKHYQLGTLVGEVTGGYATMYGNIVDVRLPNTGLRVWMPTSVVYGQAEGPVVPDHRVTQSIEDIAQSRDTVLDFTLQLIAGN